MEGFFVKINRELVEIEKDVFLGLLRCSPVKNLVVYQKSIKDNYITLSDLKDLAHRADVPYPLFFATNEKATKQINDNDNNLFKKLPSKNEMEINSRGGIKIGEIELIAKDLGRKQKLLNERVLPDADKNNFIGCVAKMIKENASNQSIADVIRNRLSINISDLRTGAKKNVLRYLSSKAEDSGILVSFSSHNFMPQNLDRNVKFSCICIKDKKFPYIFINTRDGDENPLILESDGRQVFTLVSMLVSIAMNKFVLNTKKGIRKSKEIRKIHSITGEILIPRVDILGMSISGIDDLKEKAQTFKVTPSMLLVRLKECGQITPEEFNKLKSNLRKELDGIKPKQKHSPTTVNGYAKYNGQRFSREVIGALNKNKISLDEVKNVLFRKGKMSSKLLQEYKSQFI